MLLKQGVNQTGVHPAIWYAIGIADHIYRAIAKQSLVVTSLTDGQHIQGSLHYTGKAVDLRTRNLQAGIIPMIMQALTDALKVQGFTILLNDAGPNIPHIHIQYDERWGKWEATVE